MRLDWTPLELSTRHAFNIARRAAPPVRRNVWLRLRDDQGREGWGEAAPQPFYGETTETVLALLPRFADALADLADPFALERVEAEMDRVVAHHASLKSALSAALHDLVGKRLGVPVWRLWGLDPADAPRSSFTIGIDEPEVMRAKVREAVSYPILKLKVGTADDERILRLIRDEAPDKTIRVDANTGWTPRQALRSLPMLEEFGIEFVEQPLHPDDHEGMRLLARHSRLPLVADESCASLADIPRLAGAFDVINIKLSKCGSLREAVRMVHAARAHGMRVMLGCMIESTLGIAAMGQVAPLADYIDLDGAALLAADPFRGPGLDADGTLRLPDLPGLGVERTEDSPGV